MLFEEYYDRSLWLMLNSDEYSREFLIEFIRCLDDKSIDLIRSFIVDQEEDYDKGNFSFVNHRQMYGDNYHLRVENSNDELKLKLDKWTNDKDRLEERYELSLMPTPSLDVLENINFGDNYIGNFSYKSRWVLEEEQEIFLEDERENVDFIFGKNFIGYSVSKMDSLSGEFLSKKYIDINKMPDRIYPHYFKSEKRLNRLVRRKKK